MGALCGMKRYPICVYRNVCLRVFGASLQVKEGHFLDADRKTHIICTIAQMIVAIEWMQIPFNAYYNEKVCSSFVASPSFAIIFAIASGDTYTNLARKNDHSNTKYTSTTQCAQSTLHIHMRVQSLFSVNFIIPHLCIESFVR